MTALRYQPVHGLPLPFRPGEDPIPKRPFVIHRENVQSEWIDYNGHMNVAYYVLAFDHATDRLFDLVDIGIDYVNRTNNSAFVLETHVGYRREVHEGDPLDFTLQLIDADDKRMHIYFEMLHGGEGWLSATSELTVLHVDLDTRRSAPFPDGVKARIEAIFAAHADLPRPEAVGRALGIRRKG